MNKKSYQESPYNKFLSQKLGLKKGPDRLQQVRSIFNIVFERGYVKFSCFVEVAFRGQFTTLKLFYSGTFLFHVRTICSAD